MADTKKMFVIILLIVSIGIISNNINLTGKASLGVVGGGDLTESKISINPKSVDPGDSAVVTIKPGSLGAYKDVKFCRENGACIAVTRASWCKGNYKCYEDTSFNYVMPTDFDPGNYVVKVYDYVKEDYVEDDFKIENVSKVERPAPRAVYEQINKIYGHINRLIV